MAILILTTGGTIDDLDYDSPENEPKGHLSLIPELLIRGRFSIDYSVRHLMAKDSRFITDEDREKMLVICEQAEQNQILLTHGTLTMVETSRFLGKNRDSKTIVLFGSHIPGNKPNSDALANLGSAITAVQILDPGVYIAMNGTIFSWENVRKNMDTGTFERIRS